MRSYASAAGSRQPSSNNSSALPATPPRNAASPPPRNPGIPPRRSALPGRQITSALSTTAARLRDRIAFFVIFMRFHPHHLAETRQFPRRNLPHRLRRHVPQRHARPARRQHQLAALAQSIRGWPVGCRASRPAPARPPAPSSRGLPPPASAPARPGHHKALRRPVRNRHNPNLDLHNNYLKKNMRVYPDLSG